MFVDNDMYQEIRINTYEDISEIIYKYMKYHKIMPYSDDNSKLKLFFRGQENSEWPVISSVARSGIKEEYTLIDFNRSLFEIIAHIQHYDTGTRLIDYTTDYDVALCFACSNDDVDGALFLYSYSPHQSDWYTTIVMSEIIFSTKEKVSVGEFSNYLFDKYEKMRERFLDIKKLSMYIMSFLDFGFMVVPSESDYRDNLRMQRQKGCFFISGVEFEKDPTVEQRCLTRAGDNIIYPHRIAYPHNLNEYQGGVKIEIPKEAKKGIREKLEYNGLSWEYLMEDEI